MTIREILAENFNKLRNAYPNLYSLKDITKAGGGSNGTLGRISACQSGATVDTLEALAGVYGLEPWQLLVPGFNAKEFPSISQHPQEWPFSLVSKDRYEALSHDRQIAVQIKMRDALEKEEAEVLLKSAKEPPLKKSRA